MNKLDTIRGIYEAFGRGDVEAVLAPLSDDVIWTIEGPTDIVPFFGTFRGKEEVARSFGIVAETLEMDSFELSKVVGDDNTVVALGRFAWRPKSTGKRVDLHWAHVYTFKGSQIVELREFGDTWTAAQAFMTQQ